MDSSLSGSSVHGNFQAGILEQVAISYFRWSSPPREQTCILTSLALAGRLFTLRHLGSPIVDGPITYSADVFLVDVNYSLFVFKSLYRPLKLSPPAKLFCPKWSMTEFKFHMDIFSSVAVIIFHSDFFLNPFNPFLHSFFDILSLWGKLPSLWAAEYPHHYLSISGPCLTSSWSPA